MEAASNEQYALSSNQATIMNVTRCTPLLSPRLYRAGGAFLVCSWAISAQTKPGQISLSTPDFPLSTPVAAAKPTSAPLDFRGKTDYFLKSAFSYETLGRVALTTSLGQAIGTSDDWGTGGSAYGRRIGANYARHFISSGVRYGIGAARGEDPRFYHSGKQGFRARAGFVLSRSFVVQMDDGSTSVAAGRLVGSFTGHALTAQLRAVENNRWRIGLVNTAIGISSDAAIRMAREFWPDLKRKFRR